MNFLQIVDLLNKLRFGLIIAGLVGNVISFVVFSRKAFRRNSISVYCRALAVSDSIAIMFQIASDVALLFFNLDLYATSNGVCKLSEFLYIAMSPISGWILTAFSIDKLMCVLYPTRFNFIRERRFQFIVLAVIVIFNTLFYLVVPILVNLVEITTQVNGTNETVTTGTCDITTLSFYKTFNIMFLVESAFVPFAIMIVTTILIVKTLLSVHARLVLQQSRDLKNRRRKDTKFAINSVVLNTLYFFLQVPVCLSYLINVPDPMTYYVFFLATVVPYYVNFSIPFLSYLVSNSIFRRECLRILSLESLEKTATQIVNRSRSRNHSN